MKQLLLLLWAIAACYASNAQSDGDYRTDQSGNWDDPGTWQIRSGGSWSNAVTNPTAANNIYVQSGHTLTINISTAACNNLHLNSSAVIAIGNNVLEVNGKIRAYTGTAVISTADMVTTSSSTPSNGNITCTGSGELKFVGNSRNITVSGEWGANGLVNSARVEFALNGGQTGIFNTAFKANTIIISSGVVDMQSYRLAPDNNTTGGGNITIQNGGELKTDQSGATAGAQIISRLGSERAGTFTIENGGILRISSGTPCIDVSSFINNGTVIYNNSGAQSLLRRSGLDVSAVDPSNYYNLEISGSGTKSLPTNISVSNQLTINSGTTLGISSFNCTLLSTISNSARLVPLGTAAITYGSGGRVTLQQYIIGQRGFRIFANPFTTATDIATVATANGITIGTTSGVSGLTDSRSFSNATNTWSNITGTTWAANTPYALFIRGLASEVSGLNYFGGGPTAFSYSVSGTLNGNTVAVAPSNASNFMLVGNPFAAPVNTSALTNGINKSYYVYQISQGGSQSARQTKAGSWTVVLSSGTTTTIPTLGVIAYIPNSTSSYNITNADINTSGTPATSLFNTTTPIKHIALQIEQDGQLQDNLFIRAEANATANGNDANDLAKFYNDNVNFYTKSKDGKDLAIDARSSFNESIRLGIGGLTGDYQLKLANKKIDNATVILKDNFLKKETVLKAGELYNFSITADANSKGENRFELIVQSKAAVDTDNSNNTGFSAKVLNTVINNGQLRVQVNSNKPATIQVVDLNGKRIATRAAVNGLNQLNIHHKAKGMYIVQVSDGVNMVTEKVVKN